MAFHPQVGEELINGMTYRIAEHPAAPGVPYGQACPADAATTTARTVGRCTGGRATI